MDTTEIERIVKNYNKELYAKKFENLAEVVKFLEKYNLPKLSEEKSESLSRLITADEIGAVIKTKTKTKTKQKKPPNTQKP